MTWIYTTEEAASRLDAAVSTVTLHARKLGIRKRGRDYMFTAADIMALRESMQQGPGRPRKTR